MSISTRTIPSRDSLCDKVIERPATFSFTSIFSGAKRLEERLEFGCKHEQGGSEILFVLVWF